VKTSSIEQTEPDQQLVTTEVVEAVSSTLVTTEVVEAVSSVLDQVKVVFKWKGTCKLSNSATLASSRTTGERPVSLPSLF